MSWATGRSYGSQWQSTRRKVLLRDNFMCQINGRGCTVEAGEVDHIKPLAEGGDHSPENLRAVCKHCHAKKTRNEKLRGIKKRAMRRRLPEEQHPAYRG